MLKKKKKKKKRKKKWGGVSALGVKGDNHKQIRKAEQNFNFVHDHFHTLYINRKK